MTDYQTRKGRLAKKKPEADFNLADSDDFYGFQPRLTTTTLEKILYALVALYFLYFTYEAITFILSTVIFN